MSGKVVVADVVSRRVQTMHREDNKIVLNTAYDAEPSIDVARDTKNHLWDGKFRGTKELGMLKAAVLPLTIWMKLQRDGVLKDPKAFQKWLNANPAFKATEGNVIPAARP